MRYLACLLLLVSIGCTKVSYNKAIIIVEDAAGFIQDGKPYVMWTGLTDTGLPVGGLIPNAKDVLVPGDIITAKSRSGDTFWIFDRRLNANR